MVESKKNEFPLFLKEATEYEKNFDSQRRSHRAPFY